MTRYAVLFILAGLAVGLWLGFNPAAHREIVRWWARTNAAEARQSPAAASLRQLDRSLGRVFRTGARPQSAPSAPVLSSREISTTLQAFAHALQQLWVQLLLRLGIAHA